MQDLFDEPPPAEKLCGNCVVFCRRPSVPGYRVPLGDCSRHGERHAAAPACDQWFGLSELHKALYGRGKK